MIETEFLELLEDFGLEDTFLHFMLLVNNTDLLKFKQKLYGYHVRYPYMQYIDKSDYTTQPLMIEKPPLRLLELDPDPTVTHMDLSDKYQYLIVTSDNTSQPANLLWAKVNRFVNDWHFWEKCSEEDRSLLRLIDDELWYCMDVFSMPVPWLFKTRVDKYLELRASFL